MGGDTNSDEWVAQKVRVRVEVRELWLIIWKSCDRSNVGGGLVNYWRALRGNYNLTFSVHPSIVARPSILVWSLSLGALILVTTVLSPPSS